MFSSSFRPFPLERPTGLLHQLVSGVLFSVQEKNLSETLCMFSPNLSQREVFAFKNATGKDFRIFRLSFDGR